MGLASIPQPGEGDGVMRVEQIGNCTLHLGACEDVLPTLGQFDAILTDPPYGIGEAAGKNASRTNAAVAQDYGNDEWDDSPCSPQQLAVMRAASAWQIIFGGNYFELPPSSCWLVWDKQNGANDFADCELAWTNMRKAVRRIYWRWNGMIRKGDDERVHPTQKPVGVMDWCLSHLPATVESVCDPFMGSGTTGVACVKRGLRFVGIEREPKYFDIACRRIEQAQRQGDMLRDAPVRVIPKQEALL
jgi:DNA modification methylase